MAAKLGIIAGSGELPKRIIEAARAEGRPHFVLALKGAADPGMIGDAPQGWIRLGAASKGLRLLHDNGVEDLVLAGGVRWPSLASVRPDWRMARFFARIGVRAIGDNSLLSAFIEALEEEGFRVVGVDRVLGSSLMTEGPLGRHRPDAAAAKDIALGIEAARALGAQDLGQAVIVEQGAVLDREDVEGTDALIARCVSRKRAGAGGVLVKLAKPGQDRRADLPTVGPRTVINAAKAGLRGVALEAGATIVLDRQGVIDAADRANIFVVGFTAP